MKMRRTYFWVIYRTLWVNKLIFIRFEKFNFEDEIRSSPGLINIKVHFRDYYQNLQSPEFITHNSSGFISHSLWEDQKGETRWRMRRRTDGGMWSRWRLRSCTSSCLVVIVWQFCMLENNRLSSRSLNKDGSHDGVSGDDGVFWYTFDVELVCSFSFVLL